MSQQSKLLTTLMGTTAFLALLEAIVLIGCQGSSESRFEIVLAVTTVLILGSVVLAWFLIDASMKEAAQISSEERQVLQEQGDKDRSRLLVLATTLDSLTEAVVAVDMASNVIYLNPAAEHLTGWQNQDAVGRSLNSIVVLKHDTTSAAVPGPVSRVLTDCMGHELVIHTVIESRNQVKVPVEGAATPIWKGQTVTGAVLILRDSSEKRAAHRMQLASEHLKEAIIESSLDCVVLIDESGKIIEFNPVAQQTFGSKREGMLGKEFFSVTLSPASRSKIAFQFEKAVAHGNVDAFKRRTEVTALKADGTEFPAELAITELPGQKPVVYAAYLRDISDRKAAEAAIVAARECAEGESREKSLFLADMSDELRTPLNAVIGYTEILQEQAADDGLDKLKPDLDKVHNAGRHLNSLISDILDLSRIESGQMDLYLEHFRIQDVLNDVVRVARPALSSSKNHLEMEAENDLGEMHSDRMKVRQGLLNLISNASRLTSDRKLLLQVSRKSETGADWVIFRVTDVTGGIAAEEIERLAEAFASGAAPSRARFGGSGLGLVIVQHFCDMLGGSVISSRDIGRSATFGMQLPAIVPGK